MKLRPFTTATLLAISSFVPTVNATIISGDVTAGVGAFVKLDVPFTDSIPANTVGNDTFQSPNLFGFDEGQNIVLGADLQVDDLSNGSGGGSGAGFLTAGTIVASHYIFFDPLLSSSQEGFVRFDSDILGVISSTANLAASDFLINTGVTYDNPSARGLDRNDEVIITDFRQINVDWRATSPGDYIRVLTMFSQSGAGTVPEPSSLALTAIGLIGFTFARRRTNTNR